MIKKEKINAIDSLRGIAALMVCVFHLTNNPNFLPKENILREIGQYGWTGVEIFFIISGFVIPYSMYKAEYELKNIKNFLLRRITRIEPPYLVSIILVVVLAYISTLSPYYRGTGFEIDFFNLFLHVGYLNIFTDYPFYSPVYWTLAIEFQYYIVIALIFPLLIRKSPIYLVVLLGIWYSLSFLIPNGFFIFKYMPYFGLGIVLFRNYVGIDNEITFYILSVFLLGILFFEVRLIFYIIVPAFLLIKYIPQFKFWGSAFLGLISYSIYLIHVPIGGRIINITEVLTENVSLRVTAILIAILVCIIASYIYYLLIEKPSLNLAKKINYKEAKE
ncbi:putative acyltransferase [Bernardetia litoralis DSM 6794]|uniref:Putative acyltransferase n=1 Tax=Bernardetia litoralis (strain ATCC 23117 / DSM 6794 / NBRC 15988 / NCIMB 1366 / Fx l1 / Sio-4) TaxID=880071 RepID=I4AF58_BERLS|nr:acyltransferase [Bernardetia litoralis]AFM02593.1 putative acyltransferase [Bernardetia litoralis DSM 6794]